MNIHEFHARVRAHIENDKPNAALALGRALFLGFVVFTFCSGLVFTVIPAITLAIVNFHSHVIAPIEAWLDEEPRTGDALRSLTDLALLVMLVWLLRHRLIYLFTFCASAAVKAWTEAQRALNSKRPTPAPQANTDIVAG